MRKFLLLGLVCLLLAGCAGTKTTEITAPLVSVTETTVAAETVLGAIVNTFIDAYAAHDIYLSVDGHDLETGHNVYTEPLTKFS